MMYMLNFMFLSCFFFFFLLLGFWLLHGCMSCCAFPLLSSCSWSQSLTALLLAPLRYFHPIRTHESCLALTTNVSHASLVVPLLKYFHCIFNQTAVAKMWIGPFLGDLTIPGASSLGSTMLSIFCSVISAAVFTLGSSIGFKYQCQNIYLHKWPYCHLQNCVKSFSVGNLAQ